MRALIIAAAVGVLLQQATFRSRVDVIRLDVSVLDAEGRPIRDLGVDDFTVRIDGAPRRVVAARFFGPPEGPVAASSDAPVSVATNASVSPGRVLVIVADLESITPGYEKPLFETAAAFVDRLGPADGVGLFVLPGRSVEVTREHAKVRDAIGTLRGWASPAASSRYRLSVREAEAFRFRDQRVIAQVIDRECRPTDANCPRELNDMAMPLLLEAARRTQSLLPSLTALFKRLERIEVPRTVVLLSAGLQRASDSVGFFNDLQRAAETSGISMTIVQVEQPEMDASHRGVSGGPSRVDRTEGLSAIAGATDAEMYYGIARATGVFDRIRNEVVHSYQLGVESSPSDADGRKHRLSVDVKRAGATVRARNELVVPKEPVTTLNPAEVLGQPIDFAEVPLIVSTYMTRGEEPATLKVIVALELAAGVPADGAAAYALSVRDSAAPVFETAARLANGASSTAVGIQLAPGRYRLRAAVVDAAGRPGSLEIPILVGLRAAGALQFSDLILGRTGESFTPATRVPAAAPIGGVLEFYSADPEQMENLTVMIETRRAGSSATAPPVKAEVKRTSLDRRRIATFDIPSEALSPGTWIVSAVVRRGAEVVGQVSRSIAVEANR
jgi:VWFA-related protein